MNIDFVIVTLQVENRVKRKQRESEREHCAISRIQFVLTDRLNDVSGSGLHNATEDPETEV